MPARSLNFPTNDRWSLLIGQPSAMAKWPSSSNQTPSYILSSATGPKLFHHFTLSPVTHIFPCLALSPWVIFHSLSRALRRSQGMSVQSGSLWCFSNAGIAEKRCCNAENSGFLSVSWTKLKIYCLFCTTTSTFKEYHYPPMTIWYQPPGC